MSRFIYSYYLELDGYFPSIHWFPNFKVIIQIQISLAICGKWEHLYAGKSDLVKIKILRDSWSFLG